MHPSFIKLHRVIDRATGTYLTAHRRLFVVAPLLAVLALAYGGWPHLAAIGAGALAAIAFGMRQRAQDEPVFDLLLDHVGRLVLDEAVRVRAELVAERGQRQRLKAVPRHRADIDSLASMSDDERQRLSYVLRTGDIEGLS